MVSSSPKAKKLPRGALVLASASPRREALLKQIGITPAHIEAAELHETQEKGELPGACALRLAKAKAHTIAALYPDQIILSADTVVACGRRVLPKAFTEQEVRECLELLSGRRHRVHTAVCVMVPGKMPRTRLVSTRVQFKRLSAEEVVAYVHSGEGIGKAGGYAIQGQAGAFITHINGSYTGVVGLPLLETRNLLCGAGYAS